MKRVMVFGTFDIFHPGHLSFLKQAKKFGDYLIVVVARDKNVLKVKGRTPVNNEEDRLNQIKIIDIVDEAVLGYVYNPYKVVEKYEPEVICLGYDQKAFTEELKRQFPKIEIHRLKPHRAEKYKSSKLTSTMSS